MATPNLKTGTLRCYRRGCPTLPGDARHLECREANARTQQEKRRRRRKAAEAERDAEGRVELPDGVDHGDLQAYGYHACRCQPCRDANALAQREWKSRQSA